MTITAAADGSALGNPGPAGWAWYIDEETWRAGGWPHGTNNMGELMAVLDLLRSTAHRADEPLRVLCDSQYVINSITRWMPGWKKKGWRKKDGKPVLNVELMQALDAALAGRDVSFEWVKGHAGHELNEAADVRARAVATSFQTGRPAPTGPGFGDRDATAPPVHGGPAAAASAGAGALAAEAKLFGPGPGATAVDDGPDPVEERHDPDLLSELLAHEQELARGLTPEQEVEQHERRLLDPAVRGDPRRAAELLHEDFHEVAGSGRWLDRRAALEVLAADPGSGPYDVDVLARRRLAGTAVQLVYRLTASSRTTIRSSTWIREDAHNELGPWQLLLHHATPES
ncbi:RNase H family protein [Kocuria sp. M1R5S2]|uniref:RNase H family protein n=1 Tax=Kocuria rhizosphaerae TaxID=3376285 RepID=UPI003795449E